MGGGVGKGWGEGKKEKYSQLPHKKRDSKNRPLKHCSGFTNG